MLRGREMDATLSWPGRTFVAGETRVSRASRVSDGVPKTNSPREFPQSCVTERYGDGRHRLIRGDALEVVDRLTGEGHTGKVDLVYVDPPFLSQTDYVLEARLDGRADGRVKRSLAYEDRWSKKDGGPSAYLDMLAPRLDALTRLLSPRGTIWVHLDWRAAYLVRVLLDEIMGREAFKNEIVWRRAPNLGRQAKSAQFGRTLDTIVVYGGPRAVLRPPHRLEPIEPSAIRKDDQGRFFTSAPRGDYTDASIAKLDEIGRVHRTASGKVYIKYFLVQDADGRWCRERPVDTLWTDIAPLRHAAAEERTGYPTQKPRALLERIISCATEPDALVVDVFSGSGTTAEAAHRMGRRAIVADAQLGAIFTSRARFIRAGMGFVTEELGGGDATKASARSSTSTSTKGKKNASGSAKATFETRKLLDGSMDVELVSPKEPLAWAVGETDDKGVFVSTYAAARTPGKKADSAYTRANVPSSARVLRVFTDEGETLT
jgi:DNA modification methylase